MKWVCQGDLMTKHRRIWNQSFEGAGHFGVRIYRGAPSLIFYPDALYPIIDHKGNTYKGRL